MLLLIVSDVCRSPCYVFLSTQFYTHDCTDICTLSTDDYRDRIYRVAFAVCGLDASMLGSFEREERAGDVAFTGVFRH